MDLNRYRPLRALIPELEEIIDRQVAVEKPLVNPKKVDCSGFREELKEAFPVGVSDAKGHLNSIAKRAVQLMTNTINELSRVRAKVRTRPREKPADLFENPRSAESLAKRMNIDVNNRASWSGDGPGTVGLVIRWLTQIRDLLASGDLRYTCLSKGQLCDSPTAWAWTIRPTASALAHRPKFDFYHIRLCERFWKLGRKEWRSDDLDMDTHFEFQAQTLIHETSHIYYASTDLPGVGPWVAECVNRFVAETNGVKVDTEFDGRCGNDRPLSDGG